MKEINDKFDTLESKMGEAIDNQFWKGVTIGLIIGFLLTYFIPILTK